MRTPVAIRDEYLDSLAHIGVAYNKVCNQVGRGHLFTFPDVHKLSDGLFISALTYWEAFCKDVITTDLATSTAGALRSEVKTFRTKNAPYRLAERILNHPDHPARSSSGPASKRSRNARMPTSGLDIGSSCRPLQFKT